MRLWQFNLRVAKVHRPTAIASDFARCHQAQPRLSRHLPREGSSPPSRLRLARPARSARSSSASAATRCSFRAAETECIGKGEVVGSAPHKFGVKLSDIANLPAVRETLEVCDQAQCALGKISKRKLRVVQKGDNAQITKLRRRQPRQKAPCSSEAPPALKLTLHGRRTEKLQSIRVGMLSSTSITQQDAKRNIEGKATAAKLASYGHDNHPRLEKSAF